MAEKMANTIGRELRYFEYKFRKKQSTKKNKKSKPDEGPGGQMAWSDGLRSDDFSYDAKSEEMKKALPSNKGEEQLQIEVALAMSREEEEERARRAESDAIRLKMALKESQHDLEPRKVNPPKAQTTLLDMSFNANPKPASVTVQAANNDPWGTESTTPFSSFDPFGTPAVPAPVASTAQGGMTFDPFPGQAVQPVSAPLQGSVNTQNGFGVNDPWVTQPPVSSSSLDFWGQNPAAATNTAPTFIQTNDAWGTPNPTPVTLSVPVPVPAFQQQHGLNGNRDAWGNPDPFLSTNPTSQNMDPFPSVSSDFDKPPEFDPLKDFDSLHIGRGNSTPSPVILHRDFTTSSSSVARDIFPIQPILEPQQASNNGVMNGDPIYAEVKKKPQETEMFLGANSNLVNLDSWKTYQVPYVTKPLGTASHNPFAVTGPSKSLNEMKSVSQQPFQQQPLF